MFFGAWWKIMTSCCGWAGAVLIWAADKYYFHPFGHCIQMASAIWENKNYVSPIIWCIKPSLTTPVWTKTDIMRDFRLIFSDMVKYQRLHMTSGQTSICVNCCFCVCTVCSVMRLSFTHLTHSDWEWQLHLCGAVSCQLEQPQTCTAQPCSDTQYAAKNGQQEADRRPPGSRSTQLSTIEGERREAALTGLMWPCIRSLEMEEHLRGKSGLKLLIFP